MIFNQQNARPSVSLCRDSTVLTVEKKRRGVITPTYTCPTPTPNVPRCSPRGQCGALTSLSAKGPFKFKSPSQTSSKMRIDGGQLSAQMIRESKSKKMNIHRQFEMSLSTTFNKVAALKFKGPKVELKVKCI